MQKLSDLGNKEVMAQNIQHYMNEWGISRKELANKLGLSYTTLSSWLQADSYPRIDKIEKMANFFQISKADLVERHQNDDRPAELTKTSACRLLDRSGIYLTRNARTSLTWLRLP
ncbi:hypothetical protein CU5_34 [Lactobacillus phage phiPYB5]|uniref:transcriptional regulator n=1 Tax=Lactobacillus phage phiPYB5 TaxID=438780 RepID=UPI0001C0AD98|nr:transcriptional regulator [Lactobacillus phage phiPYB5]ADA79912.1 hypothetical protein CU5_34 [Lactobacillus phage phiPYB5]